MNETNPRKYPPEKTATESTGTGAAETEASGTKAAQSVGEKIARLLLARSRLFISIAIVLSISGAVLWLTMVRQEDPKLNDYWGQITIAFPGADALTMERTLLKPVNDALAEVAEIRFVRAKAYSEMIVIGMELSGDTRDFTEAWDEVRRALARAEEKFPDGAGEPVLNKDLQDPASVVLALTGSADLLELRESARRLKDRLQHLPGVARVELVADPGEQITIELDDPAAYRHGLSGPGLSKQLEERNRIIPAGSIKTGELSMRLRPLSEFRSVEEISETPILLASGAAVELGELARVRHGVTEPARYRMRFNGELAVGLAIVPKENINLVSFGAEIRRALSEAAPLIHPLRVHEVSFQPDHTQMRISELNRSLVSAMFIVAGVLILSMGLRMGLIVTTLIPLVTLSALSLFALGGGVLHQISIASFVLALGMLVDNAIVMAENIQHKLDRGLSATAAASQSVSELAIPLVGATATTLAAFVPMYISEGPTADFTRSIPIIIMLCLVISFAFAMLVSPPLCRRFLLARPDRGISGIEKIGYRLADISLNHAKIVLFATILLLMFVFLLAGRVEQQFFPAADRNQFVIDLKLNEGSHLSASEEASRIVEQSLMEHEKVLNVTSFIGRGVPLFYYNLFLVPFSPHFAQLIVEASDREDVDEIMAHAAALVSEQLPGVEIVNRKLEQGPPVEAPIEVRVFTDCFEDMYKSVSAIKEMLANIPGTRNIRHDMSSGAPMLRLHIDDAVAARHGLSRADISYYILGRTRGLSAGELYFSDEPVEVFVRSSKGEQLGFDELAGIELVGPATGRVVPLGQLVREEIDWSTALINQRDGRRLATVSSQLAEGVAFSQVLDELRPRLENLNLPPGVEIGLGGDLEGAGDANKSLLFSLPVGFILLFAFLMAEFNSFRRVGLVLMTVPLAAAGVVPGLLLMGQPFGFMSLLGIFALAGVVVNNAIVLLAVIERQRDAGAALALAVREAVARRIRPILLSAATTVAGLTPLLLSSSTLWPPLASAMISGLIASTILTLLVFPAAYSLLIKD